MMKKISPTLKNIVKKLNDGECHSGASLGEALNISRNAIWKQINQLVKYGIEVESIQSTGYRLKQPLILLDSKNIKKFITATDTIKLGKIDILGSISSTSDYFRTQAPINGLHFCLAEHQSAGRGRFGRAWSSPFGANIYLSCRWSVEQDVSDFSGLSLMISLAVIEALTQFGVPDLTVKWPNDILWQGKKFAGILVEMQAESNGLTQVIIGIGINVNMTHANAQEISQPWTSVEAILGQTQDRNKLAGLLINQLLEKLSLFSTHGFRYFIDLWSKYDNLFGKKIGLKVGKKIIHGIAQGVNAQGYLLLEDQDHVVHACSSGEASILK